MPYLVLLGDSIFDNGAYTAGGPAVIQQLNEQLPAAWRATLGAIDGSTTQDVPEQVRSLPVDATHLLLSIGGNDALLRADILDTPVTSSAAALRMLHDVGQEFAAAYRTTVDACLATGLPLVICTIYNGNFPDPDLGTRAAVALTVFNDAILRTAIDRQLTVIELRCVCDSPEDYANPIEPSSIGGAKIAAAIVRAITGTAHGGRCAQLVGG